MHNPPQGPSGQIGYSDFRLLPEQPGTSSKGAAAVWPHGLHNCHCPACITQDDVAAGLVPDAILSSVSSPQPEANGYARACLPTSLVDQSTQPRCWQALHPANPTHTGDNRCRLDGLGCTLCGAASPRSVAPRRECPAHQSLGNASGNQSILHVRAKISR